jgi:hypothetical protein
MRFELHFRRPLVLVGRGRRYWHLRASNERALADSGEGYNNRADALGSERMIGSRHRQPGRSSAKAASHG